MRYGFSVLRLVGFAALLGWSGLSSPALAEVDEPRDFSVEKQSPSKKTTKTAPRLAPKEETKEVEAELPALDRASGLDVRASDITLEDVNGEGYYVVCSYSAYERGPRGIEFTGSYDSNGWGTVEERLNGACRACLSLTRGSCRFSGCTARRYYTSKTGERLFSKESPAAKLVLDEAIDTSCEDARKTKRMDDKAMVGLVDPKGQPIEVVLGEKKAPVEKGRGDQNFSRSYGYSESYESNSSGYMHRSRTGYDSAAPFNYHEEVYRAPAPRYFGPGYRSQGRPMPEQREKGREERLEKPKADSKKVAPPPPESEEDRDPKKL